MDVNRLIFVAALQWLFMNAASTDTPIVSISDGNLRGQRLELIHKSGFYYSFKGIPYAAPPLGKLRFKEPQAVIPWKNTRDALDHGDECYQFDIYTGGIRNGSEDCLFINVYTQEIKPKTLFPVVFFIHGGAFKSGSGNSDYYGPDFLVDQGLVVVTFNYRLEVMGFLSLENDDVPGNAGMKDQVAALKWVQQNIHAFGGDASKVTIFGQSSSSACVGHHLLSPMSRGLFHRAILNSGVPISDWAISTSPRQRAILLAESLGFVKGDDKKLLKFLRAQPKEILVNKEFNVTDWEKLAFDTKRLSFSPVIEKESENSFLTMDPNDYLRTGKVTDVEVMIGYTTEEAIFFGKRLEPLVAVANSDVNFFLTRRLANNITDLRSCNIAKEIKQRYLENDSSENITIYGLINYFSWTGFKYDTIKFANLLLPFKTRRTFLYRFAAESERNYNAVLYGPSCCKINGTSHSDDLPYIFNQPVGGLDNNPNTKGMQLVAKISPLWANFVKYGNPTPTWSLGFKWKPYTSSKKDFIVIGNSISPSTNPDPEEYEFWEYIYAKACNGLKS